MKRIIPALALLTVVSMGIAGCSGDDDDSASNAGGKGNTAGAPGNAGSPAAGDGNTAAGGASSGNVMCDPTQKGVCQNDTDCPLIVDGTVRITSGTCGQGCVGKATTCTLDCIQQMLDTLSTECATCYADTVNCTTTKCLGACVGAPESDDCKQCQVDMGCRAAFDDCSGLPG